MHSSDGHDTHSSSAASDEERCGKKAQAISIAEERADGWRPPGFCMPLN